MPEIPRDGSLDSSAGLAIDGYAFISKRCERLATDVFRTRLMLRETICMRGEGAARLLYDPARFVRAGAAPVRMQKTLIGAGGVQTKDGEEHASRKQMLMALITPESVARLVGLFTDRWNRALDRWEGEETVVLFPEVEEILCHAVCEWSGVPVEEAEVRARTDDLSAMIDGAGGVGPRHWRGRFARGRAERWIATLLERVRAGELDAPPGSVVQATSWHRDPDGELLEPRVAAVEVLNILRPTVAIARYVVFAAHALHEHAASREALLGGDPVYRDLFVQEVRRYYPFFPFVAAVVRDDFEWRGYHFPAGTWTMLDLYGTNRDARIWGDPAAFRPERFREWNGSPFNFIPQGGGEHLTGHRCAGELVTIEVMKAAVDLLTGSMQYHVPEQDLTISLARVPAIPRSRFVIDDVRRVGLAPRVGHLATAD